MKQNKKLPLPIDVFIPEILTAVSGYSTVLINASPGSGKTTRLPWAIASQLNKKVVVLEPRRIAAKMAAMRIADEEELALGKEVGYHFRFEKKVNPETKVIFYTEGTFLKRFIGESSLSDVDVVILDEFHERHLETDLALALLRELQTMRRDLKIILMSATLDLKTLNTFNDSKMIEIISPIYPVEISYLPNQPSILNESLELKVKKAISEIKNEKGDILVFLPGMREMQRVQNVLSEKTFLLHADLTKEEQEEALGPSSERKIILSTNIAESSVTIPGIKFVIDSGIQRQAYHSPWSGLKLIKDFPVTKSSAIQRAGRAGRTGPGKCIRLYSEQDFNQREDHTVPEIERADLTDMYLLVTGTKLKPLWFHQPPVEKWEKASTLLEKMGAIFEGELTPIGKEMLEIPLDARLSRIIVACGKLTPNAADKLVSYICDEIEMDRSGILKRRLRPLIKANGDEILWEKYLLLGFVDQVGRLRNKQHDFIHYSGKVIRPHHSLSLDHDYYLILDITQKQEAIKIFPIDEEWLWELSPFPFNEEPEIDVSEKISIKTKTKLGSIVIDESVSKLSYQDLNPEIKGKLHQLALTPLRHHLLQWQMTPQFERFHYYALKQNRNLIEILETITPGMYFKHINNLSWDEINDYFKFFSEENLDISNLERELPFKINLGGKRELTVHYPVGMEPYLEAPIQDFYGLNETPSIFNGRVPLTLKLLGPHKRPMQVTKDLKNFWNKTYQEMKKEYQRDYPRHHWPEKPWEAKPILLKRELPK